MLSPIDGVQFCSARFCSTQRAVGMADPDSCGVAVGVGVGLPVREDGLLAPRLICVIGTLATTFRHLGVPLVQSLPVCIELRTDQDRLRPFLAFEMAQDARRETLVDLGNLQPQDAR
jgi:hypothetical protein